jgi:hypothetical protein
MAMIPQRLIFSLHEHAMSSACTVSGSFEHFSFHLNIKVFFTLEVMFMMWLRDADLDPLSALVGLTRMTNHHGWFGF